MIRVFFDPSNLGDPEQKEWWEEWTASAETATEKALDQFEEWLDGDQQTAFKFNFNGAIWTKLRDWLLENVFYQKCAYCEREISGYYGDAEHYRPKGSVKRKLGSGGLEASLCEIVHPVKNTAWTKEHPGYFWLAYDWRNLVPACVYCNSGQGKNDRFDITLGKRHLVMVKLEENEVSGLPLMAKPRPSKKWPGYYYLAPAGLDALEEPLLLNPLNAPDNRDPRRHIRFGVRGIAAAVDGSPIGVTSLETFQLKTEKLRQQRQKAQESFRDKYFDAMRDFDPSNPEASEAKKLLKEYGQGRYPFSAAALDYHRILKEAEMSLSED